LKKITCMITSLMISEKFDTLNSTWCIYMVILK
jgi:hypothetical protein